MRWLATIPLLLIAACDSPFFGFGPAARAPCAYAADLRCEGFFPGCRPSVTLDGGTCEIKVQSTCLGPELAFEARIEGGEVEVTAGTCVRSIGDPLTVVCGSCEVSFVEEKPLPYLVEREICRVSSCEGPVMVPPTYQMGVLSFANIHAGFLLELVAEGGPISVENVEWQNDVACPATSRGTEYFFIDTNEVTTGRRCVHTLEAVGDGYVGVFGNAELRVGKFDVDLSLQTDVSLADLVSGEPIGSWYAAYAIAYHQPTQSVAVALTSSNRTVHLLRFDAETLARLDYHPLTVENGTAHEVYGMQFSREGLRYTDDGFDTVVEVSMEDFREVHWRASLRDERGRLSLGSLLIGEDLTLAPDSFDSELFIVRREQLIGSAGALTEQLLTPTAIEWAGDLVAVGMMDKQTKVAHLAFFDPATLRYLPGSIPVGMGPVARIRAASDSLWLMLPWQGKVVELRRRASSRL